MTAALRSWMRRLLLPWRGQHDGALAEEIRSHLALHVDELVAAGQAPDEARRTALLRLGGVAQTLDSCRETRRFSALAQVGRDATLAARRLRRDLAFTAAAVTTLALGIGATSAIFSVARLALLAPLPYAEPDRRVMIFSRWNAFQKTSVADQEIWDYRATARTLQGVAAWYPEQTNLTGSGRPARLTVGRVTANTLDVLGAAPAIGRGFTDADDRPRAAPVVLLGHDLWVHRFNSDPGIVGRTIVLDDVAAQVTGVMPAGFRLPTDYTDDAADPTELWRPAQIDETQLSRSHSYNAAARLAPGQTPQSATQELDAIARRLTEQGAYHPAMHFTAFAVGLDDEIRGPVRPVLWLLVGGVVCLLLIACANVGNLLLVRGEARQREFALRAALGAGPGRLARDTLIEALVLALAGTAAGLPLAVAGLRVVSRYQPATLHAFGTLALYWPMVLLAMVAAVATTAGFSLAPVLGRTTVSHTLRDSGTHTTASGTRARTRRLLVLLEVGIATILLIAAGLVLRSIDALRRIDLGFNPAHVVTMRVALPETRYRTPEQIVQFYERLRNDAQALAGVRAAGVMRLLPLATTMGDWGLDIDGFDETSAKAKGDWQIVTDGAFEAMGIHLLRGRWFEASDRTTTEPVAVVNETLARTYWRSMDEAIGGRMRIGSEPARPWIRVIGIVADDRHNGVTVAAKEKFYIPHSQWHVVTGGNVVRAAYLVVRADGDPMRLAAPLQHVVEQIDPDLPVGAPRAMTDVVNAALATSSLTGFLLATFAAIALALAAIGIYGVLAYVVSRRAREIGIRIALGSTRSKVVALVVRQGITMGASGIAWGSAAAFALAGLMRGLLYRVAPTDAATFAAVGSLLLGVTTIASIVPAMRACNASLLETLKSD